MYTAMVIGVVVALVFGAPAVVWLLKRLWPPSADEERIHRGIEEARGRMDRYRRY